ncbi:cupin domain-containing protein, partial [Patescibacteria group bacterium]|nr:cupin domain-containing protein [Patescibacteria group bacterium]
MIKDMFSKKNIKDIPVEGTSHASGSRKTLLDKEETSSKYFEAYTYGYLPPGVKWEMHEHDNIVEICVVVKGSGVVRDEENNEESFELGDRFVFPSNTKHEIENTGQEEA